MKPSEACDKGPSDPIRLHMGHLCPLPGVYHYPIFKSDVLDIKCSTTYYFTKFFVRQI